MGGGKTTASEWSRINVCIVGHLLSNIYFHYVVFNKQMVDIQRAGSGRADDFTPDVEYRTMAGTGKLLLFIQPGDCAPKVRTLTGDS